MNVFSMLGAAGGMDGLLKQVEDFKSQFERLVSSMEQMQRDLDVLKSSTGVDTYHDAYRGARDEMLAWKKRAIELGHIGD